MKKYLVSASYWILALTFMHSVEAQDILPVQGSMFGPVTPTVAEIDGNPANGREVIVVSLNARITAVRANGSTLWSAALPAANCSEAIANDRSYSSAVVGDLFGDGVLYVVAAYGGFSGRGCDGGVVAYRASDGARKWNFSLKRWSTRNRFFAFRWSVVGTPALADVDGDGDLEVGFGAFDRNVYLLNSNGTVRWYYNAADTVHSSPGFMDIDGDRKLEMIIGTDISRNKIIQPPTPDGGFLYALRASIKVTNGKVFRFRDPTLVAWKTAFNQVLQTPPVIADLIPSNPGDEIIVGSGCYFPEGSAAKRGKWYKVFDSKTGRVLRTLKVTACTPTAPAVGDINGDGSLDVVAAVSGNRGAGGDGTSRIVAWNPNSNQVLWTAVPRLGVRTDSLAGHHRRQPVIADISGDGVPEVMLSYGLGIVILDARTGVQLSCDSDPCTKPSLKAGSLMRGSVAVADTDLDGIPEVLAAGKRAGTAAVLRWEDPLDRMSP